MKKLVATIFFAMLAGNVMAQAGGAAGGAAAGSASGSAAGAITTIAVAVVGLVAAGSSNSTTAVHP